MKHFFLTPDGNTLIGANVVSQFESTLKRELEADIPRAFVKRVNSMKQYVDLINNHRIMYRPFDDADKLRSYNLTQFVILEASEVKQSAYVQLKTRLRNTHAALPEVDEEGRIIYKENGVPNLSHDWRKGIIESNPSSGWIRNDVLLTSDVIEKHGEVFDVIEQIGVNKDPYTSSHVTSTSANKYLPEDFIEMNSKGKPTWWTNRYLYGSFLYAEGLVYPSAMKAVVKEFEIPKEWKRFIAFDYGLVDDSVFIFAAVDEKESKVYIYKEIRTNDKNVETLAKLYKQGIEDIPSGCLITSPIIDPKSGPRRDYEKKTLADHFLDFGIAFKPGYVNKDARIFRTNTYFESGKLKIMDCCAGLIRELREYKFKADESVNAGYSDKPVDKDDHGISA